MNKASIRTSIAAVCCCLALAGALFGQSLPTTKGLTPAEELELRTLTGQLLDASRQAKTRTEAAELLLSRTYPQAGEALQSVLADGANRGGQIAVAEAIARGGAERVEFIDPLMAMLTGEEASVRSAAARALAVYRNGGVLDRLIEIARDANRPSAVRLEVIASLQKVLDQRAVGALVGLLEDRDASIAAASADSLARLTNLRSFGADAQRWKEWWARNGAKPRAEWLADLAGSLQRSQADLEAENMRYRDRLAKAMEDLYTATVPAGRDAVLAGYLRDPIADVRLTGERIIERRQASAEKIAPEIVAQVKGLLADADVRVRQKAALLLASLGEPDAAKLLLERLAAEDVSEVRKALLAALGQLADPASLPAVLAEVKGKRPDLAAAAARALARIAARQKLEGPAEREAAQTLADRYRALARAEDGAELPEALLTAMGALADEGFLPVLIDATKDPAATIRLAAVNGLKQYARPEAVTALEGLAADGDRGVRQAALGALGAMGGQKSLQVILSRTDGAVEADAAVRQQAWDAAMGVLAKADAATLKAVASALASRDDAANQRIKVRQMLVAALKAGKDADLPDALRQLGADLLAASRPAEAAPAFGEAQAALAAAKDPKALDAWQEWIGALTAADDPAVAKALADQADEQAFALGLQKALARVEAAAQAGKWSTVVQMGSALGNQLAGRLTAEQARQLQTRIDDAKARQADADRQNVPALVAQIASGEEAARKAALAELQAMGESAVAPLLDELKKALSGEAENRAVEGAVLDVLKQLAPKLAGYDPSSPKADRLKVVEGWKKTDR